MWCEITGVAELGTPCPPMACLIDDSGDGACYLVFGAAWGLRLKTGERLQVETPGGGGWGRIFERSGELVERDIAEGLITLQAAREIYHHTRSTPVAAE